MCMIDMKPYQGDACRVAIDGKQRVVVVVIAPVIKDLVTRR